MKQRSRLIPKYLTAWGPLPKIGTPEAAAYTDLLNREWRQGINTMPSETILNNPSVRIREQEKKNQKATAKGREIRLKRERVKLKLKHNQTAGMYTRIPLSEEEQRITLFDPQVLEQYTTPPTVLEYTDEMKVYNEKMQRLYDNQHMWNGLYLGTPHGNVTRLNLPVFESIAQGNSNAINYGAMASGLAAAPIRTLLSIGTGTIGHELGDKYIGGPMGGFLGMMAGAPVGFKVGTWGKNNISFSPENGLLVGRLLFKIDHNTMGSNGKAIKVNIKPKFRKGDEGIYLRDDLLKYAMDEHGRRINNGEFQEHFSKFPTIEIGGKEAYLAPPELLENAVTKIFEKKAVKDEVLKEAKKIHKEIIKEYREPMLELSEQAKTDYGGNINWNWYEGGPLSLSRIPYKVATAPVPNAEGIVTDPTPMMKRFFNNILDPQGAILTMQRKLTSEGRLIYDDKAHKWYGANLNGDLTLLRDPTLYILNELLIEMGSTNRVSPFGTLLNIPYHGTITGTKDIYKMYANPSKKALFTSILNGKPGAAQLLAAYTGNIGISTPGIRGTSIPVLRKTTPIELPPLDAGSGRHASNAYGSVGELKTYFNGGLGHAHAQKVIDVSDGANFSGNSPLRLDEYNFGEGTPDIGFMLNTFDFLTGKAKTPFTGMKKGGKIRINIQ